MQLDVTEGSYTIALGPTLDKYATQWEYTSDIENYGGKGLTNYANVKMRFTTLALWEPTYGGRVFDGYNDFDSVEVGNCNNAVGSTSQFGSVSYPDGDGLTLPERQTVLSLWSLASSPQILGTNLTHLCRADMRLLGNRAVLSVEQDGIDASMIVNGSTEKVVAKTEQNGDVVVGLFNTTSQASGDLNHSVRHRLARRRALPAGEPVDAQGSRERKHDQCERAGPRRGLLPGQADSLRTPPAPSRRDGQACRNASRSALIVSAWVVGMPLC